MSRKNLSLVYLAVLFSRSSFVWCAYERDNREIEYECKREGKTKRERVVCVHEWEIHYSDNESIWDNMRQFTSPVVVSSIQGALSSSEPEDDERCCGLVSMPAAAAAQSSFQEYCQVCLFRSFSLSTGLCCLCPLVKACSVHLEGFIVSVAGAKTGSDKSCFSVKATYLQKWQLDKLWPFCKLWSM